MGQYKALLGVGVAREMARMVLPVNLYTEWYWTVNARALMHFITLRSENHAQWEMRQYSHALARFMSEQMPLTWAAFSTGLGAGYEEMREAMNAPAVVVP
jgi:thymidylate synthase (FAD)